MSLSGEEQTSAMSLSGEEQTSAMSLSGERQASLCPAERRPIVGAPERADMHEMAITQSVVETVCEHAAGRRVHSVRVQVGALCGVVPDAMEFCFGLATEGTVADGASLDLDIQPGSARCRTCGHEFAMSDLILLCPCGSADVEVLAGRDLKILSMEVS
jgi:hydrogenase nickel incorporation protein HypA/HybF